jgi:tetratricopeptide (TPR) repeat protein
LSSLDSAVRNGALAVCAFSVFLPVAVGQQATPFGSLSGVSSGRPGNSSLTGIVETANIELHLTSDAGAIHGAVVRLLQLDGIVYKEEKSGGAEIRFNNIAQTEYNIQVVVPGYHPAVARVNTMGQVTSRVTIELKPLSAEEAAFAQQIASLPPKAQKELGRATEALRVSKYAEARTHLDALLRLAPNHPEANYLYGVYASKNNDEPHAISYWLHALEADPNHLRSLLSLSEAYLREHRVEEALGAAKRAVAADPSSWRSHALLANVLAQQLANGEALEQAERALELGHAQADSVEPLLAALLARQGKKDRAQQVLESYLRDHPNDPAVKGELGEIQSSAVLAMVPDTSLTSAATDLPVAANWLPPDVDEKMPMVQQAAACPTAELLANVGRRIEEFTRNLERFTATESLVHQSIDKWGLASAPETRRFDYVAAVQEVRQGIFNFEEFRSHKGSEGEFPEGVATNGLPALVMIFHPYYAASFDMNCEGLASWDGRAAWQIHFRQRPDKPNSLRTYKVGMDGPSYPVLLKGRAWISADSYELLRLETDLVAPLPQIRLLVDHTIIEYGPVQFRQNNVEMWLPRSAEVYFDWKGHRMHRRHTFNNYLLFSIDDKQNISAPKGAQAQNPSN